MEIVVAGGRLHRRGVALLLASTAGAASAMGGHFDVDDAGVLAPERCQVELWTVRGESTRVLHAGPACRVGAVELGLIFDRLLNDERHDSIAGAQLKWVGAWLPSVDGGVVVAAARDTTRDESLVTAYVPVTWSVRPALQLHANLGIDRVGGSAQTRRVGAAGEWTLDDRFTLLAERFRTFGVMATRLGLRVAFGEHASVDLSGARVSGSGNRLWGLGWSWEFGR
jgi:hypothetical protein